MRAVKGIAYDALLGPAVAQLPDEGTAGAVRLVGQPHTFALAGDAGINPAEEGDERFDESGPLGKDDLGRPGHDFLVDVKHGGVGLGFGLQQLVALLKGTPVVNEGVEVSQVVLRDDHIHEAAALLAATRDQLGVGRRNQHQGHHADVLRQAAVLLVAALEPLAAARF